MEIDHCNNKWSQKDLKLCELSENIGDMSSVYVKKILLTHDGVWQMLAFKYTWEIVVKDYSSQHVLWKMKSMSKPFCLGHFIEPNSVKNLRAYIN